MANNKFSTIELILGCTMEELMGKLVKLYCKQFTKLQSLPNQKPFMDYLINLKAFSDHLTSATTDYNCLVRLLRKLNKEKNNSRETMLLLVSSQLIFTEGIIVNLIDYICYLLVLGDHHDLFDFVRKKYVRNMKETVDMAMYFKILFLNAHGFKDLTEYHDFTFRNDIAHHKYVIDDDGGLWIRKKKVNVMNIVKRTNNFMILLNDFADVIKEHSLQPLEKLLE